MLTIEIALCKHTKHRSQSCLSHLFIVFISYNIPIDSPLHYILSPIFFFRRKCFFLLPAMNNCMFESSFFAVATAAAYYSFLFIFNFLDHIHCCVAARCKPTIPIIVVGSFCSFILSNPTMDLCEMNNKNSFYSWRMVMCVVFFRLRLCLYSEVLTRLACTLCFFGREICPLCGDSRNARKM